MAETEVLDQGYGNPGVSDADRTSVAQVVSPAIRVGSSAGRREVHAEIGA